jgi:hypothetical protein
MGGISGKLQGSVASGEWGGDPSGSGRSRYFTLDAGLRSNRGQFLQFI